jgi:hypothetical protein
MSNDNVTDFAAARFEKNTNTEDCAPGDALAAARKWLEECEKEGKPIEHVFVIMGRTSEDHGSASRYFQAGKYPYHAQVGLVFDAALMLRENG